MGFLDRLGRKPAPKPIQPAASEHRSEDNGIGDDLALYVQVNDTHINSTVAISPPRAKRDDGGWYYASPAQRWLLECWHDFWQKVQVRKRELDCPVYVIVAGDAVDINIHSQHQLIEYGEPNVILDMAEEVYDPVLGVADYLFILRGTEAHTGPLGSLEEALARRLGGQRNRAMDTASWYHLAMEVAGTIGDFAHHPQTSSRRPWTADSAAARQAAITWSEYHEIGERPPDVVGRGHVHYWAKGYKDDTFAFFGPPWQLTTAFGYRLGGRRKIEKVGGVIIECRRGERPAWKDIRYGLPRGKIWTPPIAD
jgi:hypothetical protein